MITYNCIEVRWANPNQDSYISIFRDLSNNNEMLFADKHSGLDLILPVGTPLISRWPAEIFTEGDLNVVFLLNNGSLTLKLGHIDYYSAGYVRGKHYQVKPGDIVGYVKDGNGYTITHPSTGNQKYTEIHFEIALLKPGYSLTRGNHYGGTHYVIPEIHNTILKFSDCPFYCIGFKWFPVGDQSHHPLFSYNLRC